MKNKTALITGATSGIGRATARLFAKNGVRLILCGRRQERLDALASELENQTEVCTLNFDVRDKALVFKQIEGLSEAFSKIDILINNAGNAHGMDTFQDGSIEDWDAMIDINVKGLLYVSKAIIPSMIANKSGHIINIGSTAGKEVYPKGNVYCASKHAVDAINQGMRLDLNGMGIKVGAINPGLVETEFSEVRFKNDNERAEKVYQGFTNIADLTVMCLDQASSTVVNKTN